MDIYFIDISEIIKKKGIDNLRKKYGNYHHHYSRIFLTKILTHYYQIDPKIYEDNGRPYIKDSNLQFSISHSKDIIAIAFNDNDNSKTGLDIEYIKPRDYPKILKYYGISKQDVTQDEFFQIWTTYEAEYKSGVNAHLISFKYNNYMVTLSCESNKAPNTLETKVLSDNDIIENFVFNEVKIAKTDFIEPIKTKI